MLHFKILASGGPLLALGIFAGGQFAEAPQPCIALANMSVRLGYAPWQNQQHVSFTSDPSAASVRVQIVEHPELADFTLVDDEGTPEAASCPISDTTRYVGIAPHAPSEPIIYLSHEPGADYRIFVRSKTFTAQAAAALLVGAAPAHNSQLAASL